MRLALMGTGPFAGPTFAALHERGEHDVVALVTRPIVANRGRRPPPHPLRDWASACELPVYDPPDINSPEARESLQELGADCLVVCDYGQILQPAALDCAPLGGINLHGSLLPKYRGAAPVQWAIWKGETRTGVTVIHMTPRLDAGPCLVQRETEILPDETAGELEPRLAELGVGAVFEALQMLADWDRQSPLGVRQAAARATRAPRLAKGDGKADWRQTTDEAYRQWRATQPWPGSFALLPRGEGEPLRLLLKKIRPITRDATLAATPGTLQSDSDGRLCVATSDGWIEWVRVQPAGKREMDAAEFLRGHPLS